MRSKEVPGGVAIASGKLQPVEPLPDSEELAITGTHADGVPKGLLPCMSCGEWRRECFDILCRDLVVRVHCGFEEVTTGSGKVAWFFAKMFAPDNYRIRRCH